MTRSHDGEPIRLLPADLAEIRDNRMRVGWHIAGESAETRNCSCYECVEYRSPGHILKSSLEPILDVDIVPVRHYPPQPVGSTPNLFAKQIAGLRAQYRQKPNLSTRVKTAWATDYKQETIKPFNTLRRNYTSEPVPVWHKPEHISLPLARAFDVPKCAPSPVIDRDSLKSKYAPNPLDKYPGERIPPDIFEPTQEQIEGWFAKHSKRNNPGVMKTPPWSNLRFDKHRRGLNFVAHPEKTGKKQNLKADQKAALDWSEHQSAVTRAELEDPDSFLTDSTCVSESTHKAVTGYD